MDRRILAIQCAESHTDETFLAQSMFYESAAPRGLLSIRLVFDEMTTTAIVYPSLAQTLLMSSQ